MKKDQCNKRDGPEPLAAVLARLMAKVRPLAEPSARSNEMTGQTDRADVAPLSPRGSASFDFDLVEFPLFSGKDGCSVNRSWTAYPGRLGVGEPSDHLRRPVSSERYPVSVNSSTWVRFCRGTKHSTGNAGSSPSARH